MAILKNITTKNAVAPEGIDLIDSTAFSSISNIDVASIIISNNEAVTAVTIDVFILDTKADPDEFYYLCKNLVIPGGVSLVLDEDFSFHIKSTRTLRIHTAEASPDLTVIIN